MPLLNNCYAAAIPLYPAAISLLCRSYATVISSLHRCYAADVIRLLCRRCYTSAMPQLLYLCYTTVVQLLFYSYTAAMPLLYSYIGAVLRLYRYYVAVIDTATESLYTSAIPLQCRCCIAATACCTVNALLL